MNQMNNNKNKGFSLVELIVVIAIMAVMVAVLAPSLLQYVERSRAQKDDSAMGEVANAIMLGMSDQKIYDEVLYSTAKGNVSCYIDAASEASLTDAQKATKVVTKNAGTGDQNKEQYLYGDDCRLADETEYYFAGNMRGMTITFEPGTMAGSSTVFKIGDAIINKALVASASGVATNRAASEIAYYGGAGEYTGKTLAELEAGTKTGGQTYAADEGHHYLYNRVRATVGDTITLTSQTYRRSSYTVFIRMGSTGGNSAAGQDAVTVYGQWSGTNLT